MLRAFICYCLIIGFTAYSHDAVAETFVVDSDNGSINGATSGTLNGVPFHFSGVNDGVANILISGDLILNDGDVLRGVGSNGISLLAGNNVLISANAEIDVSANGPVPGPGGGAGGAAGASVSGGQSGSGGNGGSRGSPPGSGGRSSRFSTPGAGTNGSAGGSGSTGAAGSGGGQGGSGAAGGSGLHAAGSGGSPGGGGSAGLPGSAGIGGSGGSGGAGGAPRSSGGSGGDGRSGNNGGAGGSGSHGADGAGGLNNGVGTLISGGGGGGGAGAGGGGGSGGGGGGGGGGGSGGGGGGHSTRSGGRGGAGGEGGDGANGGGGGSSGAGGIGGAGGGAIELIARGSLDFFGRAFARGGEGTPGNNGTNGGNPFGGNPPINSGTIPSFNGGRGGFGGQGGSGGHGGNGGNGGSGGGGAGGTIRISGSVTRTNGIIDVSGGEGANAGDLGRIIMGSNASHTGGEVPFVGPQKPNPYVENQVPTPFIPNLSGGADAFGLLEIDSLADDFAVVRSAAPLGATAALLLMDQGPDGYDHPWEGFDLLLFMNLGSESLDVPLLSAGSNLTELVVGGFSRDPQFGGTGEQFLTELEAHRVYGTLVPNGATNFGFGDASGSVTGLSLGFGEPAFLVSITTPTADINRDGVVDVEDIDELTLAINNFSSDTRFDLNQDGQVNQDDRRAWIDEKQTVIGDANLDGVFNTRDLVWVLAAGEFEDGITGNSSWAEGDWDGDLEFGTTDIVLALVEGHFGRSAIPVPAPTSRTFTIVMMGMLSLRFRRVFAT